VIEQLADSLASLLPLTIREASYREDIALMLAGEGWAFSTVSAWRVICDGVLAYGWSDARAADLVWDPAGSTSSPSWLSHRPCAVIPSSS
jgi:hypothetical protein